MRKSTFAALVAALAASGASGAAAAQSPEGVWRTETSKRGDYVGASMEVRVAPCAGAADRLCGEVVDVFGTDRREVIGQRVLWDLTPDGPGRWSGGKVWVPTRGRNYAARMSLQGGQLTVEGCLAVICESQVWTRVE